MIKVEGIVWDTDGKNANLPSEIVIPDMDFDDVMDYLSDQYGWCVHTVWFIKAMWITILANILTVKQYTK